MLICDLLLALHTVLLIIYYHLFRFLIGFYCGNSILHQKKKKNENDKNTIFSMKTNNNNNKKCQEGIQLSTVSNNISLMFIL